MNSRVLYGESESDSRKRPPMSASDSSQLAEKYVEMPWARACGEEGGDVRGEKCGDRWRQVERGGDRTGGDRWREVWRQGWKGGARAEGEGLARG